MIIFYFTVNTIALTKPEKAKMVESMLVQMAQSGQLQSKVSPSSGSSLFCAAKFVTFDLGLQSILSVCVCVCVQCSMNTPTNSHAVFTPGQLGEEQLKSLLERVSCQTQKTTTVKVCLFFLIFMTAFIHTSAWIWTHTHTHTHTETCILNDSPIYLMFMQIFL